MYNFELVEKPSVPVLFSVASCKHEEIGATIQRVLPSVGATVPELHSIMAGPPFVRYTEWTDDACTMEIGCPIAAPHTGNDTVKAGELGGCTVARTVYFGPYEKLTEVHEAAMTWIKESGKTVGGAPWESYLTDPAVDPDPASWQTEICWPVA